MIHGYGLRVASEVAQNVKRHCKWHADGTQQDATTSENEGDLYLAAMLALKLYRNLLGANPNQAFCALFHDLDKHQYLDRPATSLLTIAASRLAYQFQG